MAGPIHPVHQQDVEPAIAIVVEKRAAGAQRFGKIFRSECAGVVAKVDSGGGRDVRELKSQAGCGLRESIGRERTSRHESSTVHARLTSPSRIAYTTSSAV